MSYTKNTKKDIKVKYVDFWKGFKPDDFYLHKVLKEKYNVIISDKPNYLIYSCFGNKHKKYNCLKIFYTGENIIPNFNECDYAIGFANMTFEDRYLRFPNYLMEKKYYLNIKRIDKQKTNNNRKKFCIMINSNPSASFRISFFKQLSKYKQVDSGGKTLNNLGYRVKDKIKELEKYKFSIAFENSKANGYCTEKITDAFAAGTIPIYYGDPEVFKTFNKKAFIYVKDKYSIDDSIKEIIKIDSNRDLYNKMIKEKKLINKNYVKDEQYKLKNFIYNIIDNNKTFYKNEQNHLKRFLKKHLLNIKKNDNIKS